MSEYTHTSDRRHTGERRHMSEENDDRRSDDGRRKDDVCPLQALHIEKISNLEARMNTEESRSKNIESKLEVVANIDKNLEVITELFKLQKDVNIKQEKTNEKLEEAISQVATAVTQSKLDGSISFNQLFRPAITLLIGGGLVWFIYGIATGAINLF